MRQILLTIHLGPIAYGILLALGGLTLAFVAYRYVRRGSESVDMADFGSLAFIAACLAVVGVLGLRGVLPAELPIFGYGTMLFIAFVGVTLLGSYLGRQVGIPPEIFKDLGLWCFVTGILGARIWHFIFEAKGPRTLAQFLAIWDGGLIFYGSIFGGLIGFFAADYFLQKRQPYDRWKMADCLAPCVALGLALGRLGCLLNGCCFGDVAGANCPAITFPLAAPPRLALVERGLQTAAGFTVDRTNERRVDYVEPDSPAATVAGLKAGDVIVKVNGVDVVPKPGESSYLIHQAFTSAWPRSKNDLVLTVRSPAVLRQGELQPSRDLPAILPRTIPVHPTQLYETISMTLLLFFLLAYFPYRAADGILMAIMMLAYGVHRFIDEMLRSDNDILAFNMTLSQNVSILVFLGGIVMSVAVYVHAKAKRPPAVAANAMPA